jgi:hypothetical protein
MAEPESTCQNCGEPVERLTPELAASYGLNPQDFIWTHAGGNPYCDWSPTATPVLR